MTNSTGLPRRECYWCGAVKYQSSAFINCRNQECEEKELTYGFLELTWLRRVNWERKNYSDRI